MLFLPGVNEFHYVLRPMNDVSWETDVMKICYRAVFDKDA